MPSAASLHQRKAGQRPVEADARVRVGALRAAERLLNDVARGAEVSQVGERVAEVGREADLRGGVLRRLLPHLGEAALEELDGALGPAERRIGAGERREDVGVCQRRDRFLRERVSSCPTASP